MDDAPESPDNACAVCERRLLPGERINRYVTPGGQDVIVCELCKPRAEAGGWMRPDEAAATLARRQTGTRRRGRGQLLGTLRVRRERSRPRDGDGEPHEGADQPESEREPAPEPELGERSREPAASRERTPRSERRGRREGAGAAGPDIAEALAAFNASEQRRTVAGLSRSLGEPHASIHAVRTASGANGARLTVAWELAWYQWEIGPGRRGPELRQIAKGDTVDQLRAADRNWNLRIATDGEMSRRSREGG